MSKIRIKKYLSEMAIKYFGSDAFRVGRSGDGKQFFKDGPISKFLLTCIMRCVIKGMHCIYNRSLQVYRERSGSVVECLTRDRRVAGSSLTGVTALWSLSKTHLS